MTENLAHPQFSKGLSGYKVEEVDSYIDKVLDTIKDLKDQNEVLEEKIGVLAESLQKYREDEDSLREALLGAQKMGDSIIKNANNKAEITMREASVKAAHIVEEARKKVEDEKDELIRVQTAAADFKAKLIELYREHIELVTRIPVSDSAPAEEAPAVEEPIAEEVAETVEVVGPAVEPIPVEAAEEAAAEHEEQSAPVEEAPAAPVVEEKSDIPAAGEDIFAELSVHRKADIRVAAGGRGHFFDGDLIEQLLSGRRLTGLRFICGEALDEVLELLDFFLRLAVLVAHHALHELARLIPEVIVADVHFDLAVIDIDNMGADVI